jgi:hypothetical protein
MNLSTTFPPFCFGKMKNHSFMYCSTIDEIKIVLLLTDHCMFSNFVILIISNDK